MIDSLICIDKDKILELGQSVLRAEAASLQLLSESLTESFAQLIARMLATPGHIIITGIGKSGHIAGKIAATMASTGTPAFFVHATELLHGDFGMLTDKDLLICISNSGKSPEILSIIPAIKRRSIPFVGVSSDPNSPLATESDLFLQLVYGEEVCPLGMAPTNSTTATLALGDAIAIALMQQKDFSAEDFARLHPGGSLGKKLIRVQDVMRSSDRYTLPIVQPSSDYQDILQSIDTGGLGFCCVLSGGRVLGAITDGDLRRGQLRYGHDVHTKTAQELMSVQPKSTEAGKLASEALQQMEEYRIAQLLVLGQDRSLLGVLDLKDLLRAGIY